MRLDLPSRVRKWFRIGPRWLRAPWMVPLRVRIEVRIGPCRVRAFLQGLKTGKKL